MALKVIKVKSSHGHKIKKKLFTDDNIPVTVVTDRDLYEEKIAEDEKFASEHSVNKEEVPVEEKKVEIVDEVIEDGARKFMKDYMDDSESASERIDNFIEEFGTKETNPEPTKQEILEPSKKEVVPPVKKIHPNKVGKKGKKK